MAFRTKEEKNAYQQAYRAGKRIGRQPRMDPRTLLGVLGLADLIADYRSRARMKGFEFDLTPAEFLDLLGQQCHYCGAEPVERTIRRKNKSVSLVFNGIDRVNPDIGYTLANSVPCCEICNEMKLDYRFETWIDHMKRIVSRW